MEYCTPQPTRRHNPVDSICKKLQTIQWRGEREPNSPFQIPKLSSSSYDSPQCGLRSNLEALLKKGALYGDRIDQEKDRAMGMPSSAASKRTSMGTSTPMATPAPSNCKPSNVTYTITSTLGEKEGVERRDLKHVKMWQRCCSTPTSNTHDSPYFTFTRGPQSVQSDSEKPSRGPPLSQTFTPFQNTTSYSLNFSSADVTNTTECDVPYPALVVKRLSMGDGGASTAETKREPMAEISLICEENLLDTIFHACDTQRRGKVYVSHIVDYLRHTTSRSSEDSGLEELCNMLDPDHKDVSIDLDTYHAVMREWIDDCRNNGGDTIDEASQDVKMKDSISARRSMLLNMTSGSLEAFGGEASRVEFETSELVYCVTDLQMNNQKLQDEVKKLKQVVENMEDTNQKLVEENEELRNQTKSTLQLIQKEKMLKDEVEEMKATLSNTEEGRARASAQSKHMERENQSLISKIASLQEENFKITMETDELQKRISELCDINADLQVQIHSFDGVANEKDAVIEEKVGLIDELKATIEEYSSITELLRADKSKLESHIQMIHPDLVGGLSLSVAYRLNQSTTGSLQSELALAQSPLESIQSHGPLCSTVSLVSSLDETLDKEVLLLMQGPSPELSSLEFKNILNKLKCHFQEETCLELCRIRGLLENHTKLGLNTEQSLQTIQAELDTRRADWVQSLDQLAQYTDSLEKELIKMASNMRRSRTEILHLSVRVQEQENQKRQLCEELEQLRTPQDSTEASCQTPAPEEEPGQDLDWDEEFTIQDFMKNEVITNNYCSVDLGPSSHHSEDTVDKSTEKSEEGDKWTVEDAAGDSDMKEKATLYINVYMETQTRQDTEDNTHDSEDCAGSRQAVINQSSQEEAVLPPSAHSQAVSCGHPEADALPDPAHSQNNRNGAEESEAPQTTPGESSQKESSALTVEASGSAQAQTDDTVDQNHSSTSAPSEDQRGKEDLEQTPEPADMSRKSLGQDRADRAAEDSSSLLPVLVEEEETDASTATTSLPETDRHTSSSHQAGSSTGGVTSNPSQVDNVSAKTDLRQLPGKKELELSHGIETINQNRAREDRDHALNNKDAEALQHSDASDSYKEDRNGLTPSDKEVEAEFQRLALGFKCDMFTLEKRLRLEERSRDLAEENVRREISSCQGLLQALIPLCDDDNQSMEIILRLQKNLEILIQSMTRVSSRSEMLGAIHQENRIGKAVEVMIQHVENLRRMYTKEHAELLELRETLMQNERSFGSQTKKDDFQGKKTQGRRVSLPPINPINVRKPQDSSDVENERLTRRSPCPSPTSSPTTSDLGLNHALSRGLGSSRTTTAAVARGTRTVWLWLAMFVLLAGLLALLASLVMQPAVDAAPIGTGDSWMTIQQLLWPYTGLRHNGQPPV